MDNNSYLPPANSPPPEKDPPITASSSPSPPSHVTTHSPKNWLIILFLSLLFISVVVFIYLQNRQNSTTNKTTSHPTTSSAPALLNNSSPAPVACNSPLAPTQALAHVKCNYRDSKASLTQIKALENQNPNQLGVMTIPPSLVFVGEETYRGIPIKWTASQPLSAATLGWLKHGIDLLPSYFYENHPVSAIISATYEELGSQSLFPPGVGMAAYANGSHIFINGTFAAGHSDIYQVNEAILIQTLFHEWVHVVQYQESMMYFTDEYLLRMGSSQAMYLSPFNKDFAKLVGWNIKNDENGEGGMFAELGSDSESQQTTDYGKTKFIEDMADSGALFMLCQTSTISEARVKWWEQTTGTSRTSYCPSPI